MKYKSFLYCLGLCSLLLACRHEQTDLVVRIVNEWRGKEIKFPQEVVYTYQGVDTVPYSTSDKGFTILVYTDSVGCTSCKLKIDEWKAFIRDLDSLTYGNVGFQFFFHPRNIKGVRAELYASRFTLPVCIDLKDKMNRINAFPSEFDFQTFLLDKQNKVLAIGNPINNAAIKELYLDMILDRKTPKKLVTEVESSTYSIDMKSVKSTGTGTSAFRIRNTGDAPFVFTGVDVSCGCVKAGYPREALKKGDESSVQITYTPKEAGPFQEFVIVRGNIPAPIKIAIRGTVVAD